MYLDYTSNAVAVIPSSIMPEMPCFVALYRLSSPLLYWLLSLGVSPVRKYPQ